MLMDEKVDCHKVKCKLDGRRNIDECTFGT